MREAINTFKLSLPIIASEYLQILTSTFGLAMLGKENSTNLIALLFSNSLISVGFIVGVGISLGIMQQLSLLLGKSEYEKIANVFQHGLITLFFLSILIVLGIITFGAIMIDNNNNILNKTEALQFLILSAVSLVPQLIYISFKQILDSLSLTRLTFLLSFLMVSTHIVLSWILIFGELGVEKYGLVGYAISGLITYTIMAIITAIISSLVYLKKLKVVLFSKLNFKFQGIIAHFREGFPISIQLGIEIFSFSIIPIMILDYSLPDQASYQVNHGYLMFFTMGTLGLAQGSSIRLNKCVGNGVDKRFFNIAKDSLGLVIFINTIILIATYFYKKDIATFFSKDAKIIELSSETLLFTAIFLLVNSIQLILFSITRALRDFKIPTVFMVIGFFCLAIPISALFCYLKYPIQYVWLSYTFGVTISSIVIYGRIKKLFSTKMII